MRESGIPQKKEHGNTSNNRWKYAILKITEQYCRMFEHVFFLFKRQKNRSMFLINGHRRNEKNYVHLISQNELHCVLFFNAE